MPHPPRGAQILTSYRFPDPWDVGSEVLLGLEPPMRRRKHSEEQIIGILKEAEAGIPAKELARRHGISKWTFYRGKPKCGGGSQSKRQATSVGLVRPGGFEPPTLGFRKPRPCYGKY